MRRLPIIIEFLVLLNVWVSECVRHKNSQPFKATAKEEIRTINNENKTVPDMFKVTKH